MPTHTLPPRDPLVGAWLIAICFCVLAMILVGGATRLTDSGLSITQWDLATGIFPPMSAERWAEEFRLYRGTTEYQVQNRGMSLADFQSIYWWEWTHRFIGRLIGVVFALPFLAFWFAGRLKRRFWPMLGVFALGALQGAIGWWMVTSGLVGRLDVSPVRLAIHLGLAFIILACALWLALEAFGWPRLRSHIGAPAWAPRALMALIFCQVLLGALLAGADGGPAYPDWPMIGHEWIPSTAFSLEPFWRNFTDNHATQHLFHRTTGYLVALSAAGIAASALRQGDGAARGAGIALGVLALLQASLGIATVLSVSPLSLSLAHQLGAAILWAAALIAVRANGRGMELPSAYLAETKAKLQPT